MIARVRNLAFSLAVATACGQPATTTPTSPAPGAQALGGQPAQVAFSGPAAGGAGAAPAVAERPEAPFVGGQKAFASVKDALLHGYAGVPVTEDELYRAAVQGMLEHVDRSRGAWNRLMTPDEYQALHSDLQGQVVGIGVEIEFEDATGYTNVLGTIPSSPAERAGVRAGDKILDVNGKLFKGKSMQDVVAEIRGKPGETLTLTILRADTLLTVPIVREVVAYEVVRDMMLNDSVGYLRVKSFNAKTPPSIDRALDDLAAHSATSLVVDLRGNPGGSFDDAIASAEAFVPKGTVIARIQKQGEAETTFTAKGATTLTLVPMVVLVDGETSSGAEVVASALQQGRKARLVGGKTFGKWSLQTVDDLPNGYAIKYTVSLIQSGEGRSFDGVGVLPDVQVDLDKKLSTAVQQETDPVKRLAIDPPLRTAVALVSPR